MVSAMPETNAVNRYLSSIQHNTPSLEQFFKAMPKGGDLHNHLSGAIYAETMMASAPNNICVTDDGPAYQGNCDAKHRLNQLIKTNNVLYNKTINRWSMRNFIPGKESAHDHFFKSFAYFLPALSTTMPMMAEGLAAVMNRAAAQHEEYLELMMITFPVTAAIHKLVGNMAWQGSFQQMEHKLDKKGLNNIVKQANQQVSQLILNAHKILHCSSGQSQSSPQPGCSITVRFLYQAFRDVPPAEVFASLITGYRLATQNPNVVGINIVGAEDGYYALKDYNLQMRQFAYLNRQYPGVHKSLHAGELTLGLVRPKALRFHIYDAINIANADRIGHGDDIAYENHSLALLKEMANKQRLVEITPTSAAEILGVKGAQNQLHLYLSHHVPIALSTDDEGVLRTDLTQQYVLAVTDQHLNYQTIKQMDRNSLTYSFLSGKSIWADPRRSQVVVACADDQLGAPKPTAKCQQFLQRSLKARLQWRLEKRLRQFEMNITTKAAA